jgi:hypothetical protein
MDFDKIQKRVGIDKLDDRTRKELFEKFQKAGGQVITNRSRRVRYIQGTKPPSSISRRSSKLPKTTMPTKTTEKEAPKFTKGEKNKQEAAKKQEKEAEKQSYEKELKATFIDKINIYTKCVLMNVTTLSGNYITNSFRKAILTEFKEAILNLQLIYKEIFPSKQRLTPTIIKHLDDRTPIYYEVITHFANIYSSDDFSLFEQALEGKKKVYYKKISVPLQIFFRKLYILHKYTEAYKTAISLAIDIYTNYNPKSLSFYSKRKKDIKKYVDKVFYYFFPRFHILFCKDFGIYVPLEMTRAFYSILYIKDDELLGKRKGIQEIQEDIETLKGKQEEESSTEGGEEEEKKKVDISSLPKPIQYGLKLMSYRPVRELRDLYDREAIFEYVSDYDKVFITAMLFYEFDEEYSVAFMSNKVKIDIDYSEGVKKDYKQILVDKYSRIRECIVNFRDYGKIVKDIREFSERKPTNYISYIKQMDSFKMKRMTISINARECIKKVMDDILEILEVLLDPKKPEHKLILNPDEPLIFELEEDKRKKLHKKKVLTALKACYCYAKALSYRLSESGDLYGSQFEINEEDALTPISKLQKDAQESASMNEQDNE